MNDDQLQTISPIDGRYIEKTAHLREYFSESALMRYRVLTEIRWLVFLSENNDLNQIPTLSDDLKRQLDEIITQFSIDDAKAIKSIEKETNPIKPNKKTIGIIIKKEIFKLVFNV